MTAVAARNLGWASRTWWQDRPKSLGSFHRHDDHPQACLGWETTAAMAQHDALIIAVVGATGLQGGAVTHRLLTDHWRVRALTRSPDGKKARALVERGAEVVQADLSDPVSLERAFDGVYKDPPAARDDPPPHGVHGAETERQFFPPASVWQLMPSSWDRTGPDRPVGWLTVEDLAVIVAKASVIRTASSDASVQHPSHHRPGMHIQTDRRTLPHHPAPPVIAALPPQRRQPAPTYERGAGPPYGLGLRPVPKVAPAEGWQRLGCADDSIERSAPLGPAAPLLRRGLLGRLWRCAATTWASGS
jgi:hypothetical protein